MRANTEVVSSEQAEKGFAPAAEFAAVANADASLYDRSASDRDGFWTEQAHRLHWHEPFSRVLDWDDAPVARWFGDGKLNVAYNCVDRHVADGHGDQIAIHWVGEPGDTRDITYRQLLIEVSRAANYFTELGLVAGDRVAIYLPIIPEAIVAMLACARLGLVHSVVFAGFSAGALRQRIEDAQARLVVTADGQWRRGKPAALKESVNEALAGQQDST
ncbi:AMP-binding protein, partial [Nocardia jiangxiensis]|uniref:AMP-binding protein n=1 Tax=Nocardia jiangxiensis TaxID=282685 RepID=UPI001FDEF26B